MNIWRFECPELNGDVSKTSLEFILVSQGVVWWATTVFAGQCVHLPDHSSAVRYRHNSHSKHSQHSRAGLFVFTEAFMRILDGSVARRNLFLVTKQEWRWFTPSHLLAAPQETHGQLSEEAGLCATPSELFQRKTFDIVMMGECEARRLRACALESAWPISQYSWENLGKKQTN